MHERGRFPGMKALLAVVLASMLPAAFAQERDSGFWFGGDFGYGSFKRSFSITGETSQNKQALQFRAGYFWTRRLLLGLEAGGWVLQSADLNDPSKGEDLGTLLLIAQYYPGAASGIFMKGGLGAVRYTNNRPLEDGGTGSGGMVGIGWDVRLGNSSFYVTPLLDYSFGRVTGATTPPNTRQDFDYRAVTLRIGVTYK